MRCPVGSSRKSEHIKIEFWRVGYDGWIPKECWEGHLHLSISCLHTRTLPWVLKKSYGKAKFQVDQTSNFMSFLDSSQKTDNWMYHSFLKIPSGTLSKMRAKFAAIVVFILKEWTYLFFQYSSQLLAVFPFEFLKKRNTSNYQFFTRNPKMASDSRFKQHEILTSHWIF